MYLERVKTVVQFSNTSSNDSELGRVYPGVIYQVQSLRLYFISTIKNGKD